LGQLGLQNQALDGLVSEYVMDYAAQTLGIQVTPEEIVDSILTSPSFQDNGQFVGSALYEQILLSNNYSIEEYEEAVRREILGLKLTQVLTDGIEASADEVRQEFLNRNQEFKIRYIAIDPEVEIPEEVGEEELQAYFEERQENYRSAEQRKIRYVVVPLGEDQVELTEAQISERMASIGEKDEVEASHILISSITPDAAEKAEGILQQLRDGADFSELAEEHSDDPGSAANGGELGFFKHGMMVPEFEDAAFSMEPGEISELVATNYGFHIIKVTDVKTLDSRQVAESQLREEEAQILAQALASKILFEARNNSDLDSAAGMYQLQTGESPFFGLGAVLSGLGARSDFNQQIFTLEQNQFTEPYQAGETYVVAQLMDIQPSQISEIETVRDEILEDFKTTRRDETARGKAFAFSQEAKEKADFEGVARSHNLTVVTSDFFKRDTSINEDLGYATEILTRVFLMQEDQVSPAVTAAGKYVVFQIAERSTVDEEQFEQEQEALLQELSVSRRQQFFLEWLQNITTRLETDEQIQINRALVDSILG
jgi:peptidyl-prolyl cis-trans isomerase D